MRDLIRFLLIAFLVLILAGSSYVAGFGSHWLLVRLGGGGAFPSPVAGVSPAPATESDHFKVFWEAWGIIEREFYGEVPDDQNMTYSAIRGVISGLDDPNTVFIDPRGSELERTDIQGKFEGIGAVVTMNQDGELVVVTPMAGQPAEQAGIRAGDIIVQVDDTEIRGLSLTEAVLLIRGPRGSKVRLTIFRLGEPENLVIEVTRGEIETPTVTWRMLDNTDGIGYLRVALFGQRTPEELQEALRDLKRQGYKALILDLRNNPGGLLDIAIRVSSQFVGEGVIVYQRWNDGREQPYQARRGGLVTDRRLPLVVLINKGSASAAEIVAGAVKDTGRGVLIGERTFGKGWVQNVHRLSDGSTLHVTTAQWLTPDRQQIAEEGIAPDLEVPFTQADAEAGHDPQLERAVEYLQSGS